MTTIAASSHSPSSTAGNLIFHCQEDAAKVCALDEICGRAAPVLTQKLYPVGQRCVERGGFPSMWIRKLSSCLFVSICLMVPTVLAQAGTGRDEIPIERCDILPIVKVRVGRGPVAVEMRFLIDTAATTTLNLKSFSGGRVKEVHITSWSGTAATSAREVSIPEFSLGQYTLHDLKVPAVDLSPIGNACGGPIDGILAVDLLDKMGATIDLKRQVALLSVDSTDPKAAYAEMELSMRSCPTAFEQGNEVLFERCLDPEIILYTPHGEFVGRTQVLGYLRERYFKYAPNLHFNLNLHEARVFANALWISYDYSIDSPKEHVAGHGFAMCRKSESTWHMVNMHNSAIEGSAHGKE